MKLSAVLLLCFTEKSESHVKSIKRNKNDETTKKKRGLVPVAVSILLTIPHRYELIKISLSWPDAQRYCREMYTDLAIILSHTDWIRLNEETINNGQTSWTMWVGLWNDVNSWRWSLGDLYLNSVTYTNWCPGQPDNYAGQESCVSVDSYGHWWDEPCTQLRTFICYNDNFSGASRFILITSPVLSWLDARAYCRQYYTDLASSLNSSDNNIIGQMSGTGPWIGLYRDTWKWTDGTNATNLPWAPGQPDNYGGNDNCARVHNDQFVDAPCTNVYYFFCHTNFAMRIIMRLLVESDGSVFDPAVQSSILDEIKQNLEENGMLQDTTVTWSVQPDGNIFKKRRKGQL